MTDPEDGRLRVLAVDDDPNERLLLRCNLGDRHALLEAACLDEAQRRLAQQDVDVVLLDLGLGETQGLETLRAFRERCRNHPVVVLTGQRGDDLDLKVLRADAQDFLSKDDATPESLERVLRHAVERFRLDVERRRLLRELVHARSRESLGEVARGMAHELNTPLQCLSDSVSFASAAFARIGPLLDALEAVAEGAADAPSPEALRRLLRRAKLPYLREQLPRALGDGQAAVERACRVVQAFARFAGREAAELASFDVNDAVQSTATVASSRWFEVAKVELDLEANLPEVVGSEASLNQALLQLLMNAGHAIGEALDDQRGTIVVRTRREDSGVAVEVQDDGACIDERAGRALTESLHVYQSEPGRTQGLALVNDEICHRHGGEVSWRPERPRGATFRIWLPLHEDTGEAITGVAKEA